MRELWSPARCCWTAPGVTSSIHGRTWWTSTSRGCVPRWIFPGCRRSSIRCAEWGTRCVRPIELARSRLFRVAILCAVMFAIGFGALIAVLYVSYVHFLERGQRDAVVSELHALQTEYAVDHAPSTAAVISLKARADERR